MAQLSFSVWTDFADFARAVEWMEDVGLEKSRTGSSRSTTNEIEVVDRTGGLGDARCSTPQGCDEIDAAISLIAARCP